MNIVNTARILQVRGSLTLSQQNRAREAAVVLEKQEDAPNRQKYRVFLFHVHSECGPHGVLLCAVELGQHKAITMRNSDRATLIDKLGKNKNQPPINYPVIRSLAEDFRIPNTVEGKSVGLDDV